jgi:hypothetical protein
MSNRLTSDPFATRRRFEARCAKAVALSPPAPSAREQFKAIKARANSIEIAVFLSDPVKCGQLCREVDELRGRQHEHEAFKTPSLGPTGK